jgi:hypothetical protein
MDRFSGDTMFFIRYNWTLPSAAQIAIGIVLIGSLASAHGLNPQAKEFAATQHNRCLQQRGAAAMETCAMQTIQLASQMHGMEFADQVAEALR